MYLHWESFYFLLFGSRWKCYLEVSCARIALLMPLFLIRDFRSLPSAEMNVYYVTWCIGSYQFCILYLKDLGGRLGYQQTLGKHFCWNIFVSFFLESESKPDSGCWRRCCLVSVYTVWPNLDVWLVNLVSHIHEEMLYRKTARPEANSGHYGFGKTQTSLQIGRKHSWVPIFLSAQWDCAEWAVVSLGKMSFRCSGLCWIAVSTPMVFIFHVRWMSAFSCCCFCVVCVVILTL